MSIPQMSMLKIGLLQVALLGMTLATTSPPAIASEATDFCTKQGMSYGGGSPPCACPVGFVNSKTGLAGASSRAECVRSIV